MKKITRDYLYRKRINILVAWTNVEDTVIGKVIHSQKNLYHMISLICEILKIQA